MVYLFGYGSLISAASVAETLQRPVSSADLLPAHLEGYRRAWSLKEQVISAARGCQITAVFLDIEVSAAFWLNGVLIKVSSAELQLMQRREKNYDCVDVTSSVVSSAPREQGGTPTYTFISQSQYRVQADDRDLFVMRKYVDKVERACQGFGSDFLHSYRLTTPVPPFPLVDGDYQFPDAP